MSLWAELSLVRGMKALDRRLFNEELLRVFCSTCTIAWRIDSHSISIHLYELEVSPLFLFHGDFNDVFIVKPGKNETNQLILAYLQKVKKKYK